MLGDENSFDVVAVGCGIAGLSAAVSASHQGAKVAVLERATYEERGGNTRYTEAFLRMKTDSEVSDDFETGSGYLVHEMSAPYEQCSAIVKAMDFVDSEVTTTVSNEAGPTLQWFRGLACALITCQRPGAQHGWRCHSRSLRGRGGDRLVYRSYTGATSVLRGATFGRLGGAHAAQYQAP